MGLVAVTGLLVWVIAQTVTQRRGLAELASRLSFSFDASPQDGPSVIAEFARFRLFQRGSVKRIANLMRESIEGTRVYVFDYGHSTPLSTLINTLTLSYIVAAFSAPRD